MSPRSKKEEYQEMAALYALGVLTQNEARAFEDVVANDTKELTEELAEFEFVAANLGFAAPEYAPPLSVRDRLLMEIANTSQSSSEDFHLPVDPQMRFSPVFSLYADQGEWLEIGAGLTAKTLFVDQARGIVTSLVRMAPGGSLPPHRHCGDEQFYVLEGDCNVHGTRLGPGDFHRAAAGSVHESTYTVEGTTFLLIAPADYEILQPAVH
ncbi:MAG: cupin domain-containing protein [Acidobacteria bacterium]|nr:cupin domain-containing protein [Acidobacteriota bacterium]